MGEHGENPQRKQQKIQQKHYHVLADQNMCPANWELHEVQMCTVSKAPKV